MERTLRNGGRSLPADLWPAEPRGYIQYVCITEERRNRREGEQKREGTGERGNRREGEQKRGGTEERRNSLFSKHTHIQSYIHVNVHTQIFRRFTTTEK